MSGGPAVDRVGSSVRRALLSRWPTAAQRRRLRGGVTAPQARDLPLADCAVKAMIPATATARQEGLGVRLAFPGENAAARAVRHAKRTIWSECGTSAAPSAARRLRWP